MTDVSGAQILDNLRSMMVDRDLMASGDILPDNGQEAVEWIWDYIQLLYGVPLGLPGYGIDTFVTPGSEPFGPPVDGVDVQTILNNLYTVVSNAHPAGTGDEVTVTWSGPVTQTYPPEGPNLRNIYPLPISSISGGSASSGDGFTLTMGDTPSGRDPAHFGALYATTFTAGGGTVSPADPVLSTYGSHATVDPQTYLIFSSLKWLQTDPDSLLTPFGGSGLKAGLLIFPQLTDDEPDFEDSVYPPEGDTITVDGEVTAVLTHIVDLYSP